MGDDGGSTDVLNPGTVSFEDDEIWGEDLDNDGSEGSLIVSYGSDGIAAGRMLLTNQFEDDEFATLGPPFYFDGRIEEIEFKDTLIEVTPGRVAPRPPGRAPPGRRYCPTTSPGGTSSPSSRSP